MKYIFGILILGLVSVGSFAASVNHTSKYDTTETSSGPVDILLHEDIEERKLMNLGIKEWKIHEIQVAINGLRRCYEGYIGVLKQKQVDNTAMRILEALCVNNEFSDNEATERRLFEIVEMGWKNKTENQK